MSIVQPAGLYVIKVNGRNGRMQIKSELYDQFQKQRKYDNIKKIKIY